jgi:regulatory factor X
VDQSFGEGSDVFNTQWLPNDHSQAKGLAPVPHQMTPEDMILQAASQLHASREYSVDSSMNAPIPQSIPFQQHPHMNRQSMPAESYSANNSFMDPDSQMMDRDGNDDGDSVVGAPGGPKPSRTSANNEVEMRHLFQQNSHRNLQDVAEELHGNERGPNSERTRQVFAMLWYVF